MANIDLTKTALASFLQGFGKVGEGTGQLVIPTFSLGSGATSSVFETSIPVNQSDTATLTMIKQSGMPSTRYDNVWFPLQSSVQLFATGYSMLLYINREGAQHYVRAKFKAPVGPSVTIPTVTIDFKTMFFDAPW